MYMIKNDNSAPLQKVPLKKGQIYFLHHGDRFSLLQDKYWFTVQFEQLQPPSSSSPQPEQQKQDSLSTSSVNPPTLVPSQSVQKFRNIVPSPKKPTTPSLLFSTTHTTSPSRRTKLSVVKENGAQFVAPPPPPLPHHKLTFQQNENTKPQNDTASHVSNTSNSLPQTGQTNETSKTNNENNVELIDPIDSDSSNNSDQFPFQFSQKRKREDDGSGPPLKYPKIEEGTSFTSFTLKMKQRTLNHHSTLIYLSLFLFLSLPLPPSLSLLMCLCFGYAQKFPNVITIFLQSSKLFPRKDQPKVHCLSFSDLFLFLVTRHF